jgi:hypothetical protein
VEEISARRTIAKTFRRAEHTEHRSPPTIKPHPFSQSGRGIPLHRRIKDAFHGAKVGSPSLFAGTMKLATCISFPKKTKRWVISRNLLRQS